jgi:hypothetical protein
VKIGKNHVRMRLELISSVFIDYFFSVVALTSLKIKAKVCPETLVIK